MAKEMYWLCEKQIYNKKHIIMVKQNNAYDFLNYNKVGAIESFFLHI